MKNIGHAIAVLFIICFTCLEMRAAVVIGETHVNTSCNGGTNGSIDLTISGGSAPYTYLWNGGANTQDRTNISAGIYTVTVSDFFGVSATTAITITEPSAITDSKSITNVACGGGSTGAVDLTVSGATPGYTFLWSDGITTEDRTGLTAANYYFTITDSRGCIKIDSANVTQPPGMVLSKTTTNVTCGSGANGAINLTVSFGVPGYNYLWNDGAITEDRSGIAAGNYTVTVTDASGCSSSMTATVGQSGSGMAVNAISTQPSCNGGNNGAITVTSVIGSVGPYTFVWSDGPHTQNRSGITAGTFTVTASSSTGCTAAITVNVLEPAALDVILTPITLSCYGSNNGAINTNASGGTPAYSYHWADGPFIRNRTGLSSGTYVITVTDSKGCTASASAFVPEPLTLTLAQSPSPLACIGGPTGNVDAIANGGTQPYSYWWGNGVVTSSITNVGAGTYCVTVTDSHGCTASACATIPTYNPMTSTTAATNVACYGASTGAINLTPSNGSLPYSYNWSNGAIVQDLSSLPAGTYTVTITDSHPCTVTQSVTITQPPFALAINTAVVDPTCNGYNNGSINITVSNGVSPYAYNWGGSIFSQNRTALTAGMYTVTATDNNSCTVSSSIAVNQPSPISIIPTVTNATCSGSNTGAINIAVTGGTAPYSYNWGGSIVTQNRVNIPAGNYAVIVTDNAGCSASVASTVIQSASLTVTPVVTNVSCNGGTNGAISITATGGTAPYNFNWGGIFTPNRTNLSQGSYTVTVTDNAGCSGISTSSVLQPTALTITPLVTNVSCNGGNSGAIAITPNGGTAPYSFNWTGNIPVQNRTGLAAGTYGVTVTDNNACTTNASLTVNQPLPISLNTTKVDVACFGEATGSINLTVTGGNSPYSFLWSNGPQTQNISGLLANSYNVTVTDANSCTASATTSITQATPIITSVSTVNVNCFGMNNGSIDLSINGGAGTYTYLWSNAATTQDISSVGANNYTVTIYDASNCSVSATATITQPAQIILTAAKTNVSCNGGANGSIDLTVNGGTSPFVYTWSNAAITQDISNLTAATYGVTVNDNNACSVTTSIVVTQPAALLITPTQTNVSCNGGNNGTINTTVTGGTVPYSYNWGGGFITANRSGLSSGNFSLTVNDANSCTASSTTVITEPAPLAVTFTKTDVICNGAASGSIDVTVNGGTVPFSYHWNNNYTGQDLASINAGNYSLTVTDANGCSSSIAVSITQPLALTVNVAQNDVSCYGGNNGSISVIASGGNGGYNYAWDNGGTTPVIGNLIAGTYTLLLTDAANCATTLSASVMQPVQMVATETHTNVLCNGTNTGAIDLTVTGGGPGLTYAWSNGAVTEDISNLANGNFSVVVTDANSCSASLSTIITQPAVLTVYVTATNVICHGDSTGSMALTVAGGTTPYNYHWTNNAASPALLNVAAGNYSVTVTDANSCTTVSSAAVTEPGAIVVTLTKTDATCFGNTNGSITTGVSGGAGAYTFNWSNSATTPNINNLGAATYAVTVHDASNCSAASSATITQPSAVAIGETHTNVSCNGGSNGSINLSISGDAGNYSYAWSNSAVSQNLTSLNANNYIVTVSDVNGCSSSKSIAITQPAALSLSETHTPYACSTHAGAIDLTVNGGTSPYAYNWTNNVNTEDINNLTSGSYTVVVTDANNCTATTAATITTLSTLSSSVTHTDVLCNGASTGAVNVTVTGGTAPFHYNWTNGVSTQNLNNIAAGNYSVVITDANNCSATNTTAVSQPAAIAVSPDITNVNCYGRNTGAINLSASGGVSPYSYAWNNAETVSALSAVTAGNYAVTVTDANGCSTALTSMVVTEPSELTVTSTVISVGCSNHNDGEIHEFVSGGIPPYVYQWMNSHLDKDLINLPTGTYAVTITDNNGCKVNKVDIVGVTPPIDIAATVKNVACVQVENGAIDLTATGGTPAYQFLWSNGETTSAISNLAQGQYAVTVSDSRGCSALANYTIAYDYDLQIDATNTTTINMGESIPLTVSANVDHSNVYSWTPLQNVICGNCQTTEVAPAFTTHYTVTAIDANGCKAVDTLTVNVNSITDIFIPNVFTPNGDGNNDVLQLYGDLNTLTYVDFMVFDRWGEKVFESNNANFTWDGTYKGELVPPGAYIYTMKAVFINGYSRPDYKGSITVLK